MDALVRILFFDVFGDDWEALPGDDNLVVDSVSSSK